MWNLEKWYRRTGLQGRNRDTDVENKCIDTKGGKCVYQYKSVCVYVCIVIPDVFT